MHRWRGPIVDGDAVNKLLGAAGEDEEEEDG